ncbi:MULTISPECIES: DUF134 domain-containing protein [unclassified Agarivorans]|uniref:DUF134 domain-containing protein n=1 Tax=unclassified Agarivorans TaxID=2636026 RepID=UPI0010D33DCC|nr:MULTISPECIES: DUF134 domain-containing protein [unclassified Agarivorans]MDO6762400.1 DUF134 domain-containing protein [Agarivorans sp. 1_MG-2023]GDY25061.1 UPF0251 protein [Agarivorans sp. Toyoura001]
MPRPKKCRRIGGAPAHRCFKPNGVPMSKLNKINILPEELEALRLADYHNMSQQAAADQMGVSRQTFGNIVNQARYKVAASLIEGSALLFEEENIE